MAVPFPGDHLGPVLYRQPPDTRGVRAFALGVLFAAPCFLLPLFRPELLTYVVGTLGAALGVVAGFALDYLLARKKFDTIHEHGALLNVGGRQQVLWFSSDTLVIEIHDIVREYDRPDDQWVFEVRSGANTFAMSTYLPGSAAHIRDALTKAIGEPPHLIERY